MAGSFDECLNLALKQKRDVEEALAKRRAAEAQAVDRAFGAKVEVERQTETLWDALRTQIDGQVDAINDKSDVLEILAEVEDRFVSPPVLAACAIHFSRKPGTPKVSLFIQVGVAGAIQYYFDKKTILSGKIAQLKPKDHETIVSNILSFAIAMLASAAARPTASDRAAGAETGRTQTWKGAKAS